MPLHANITDPDLHEPKGVATATLGQVYVANGAGSGNWTTDTSGWGFYKDDAAEQTFGTTATKLLINGADASTNEDYLPLQIRGVSNLWDGTNSVITPIEIGDFYNVRVDLPVTSRAGSNYVELVLDIGGAATPTIPIMTRRIETNRAAPFNHSIAFPIFCLGTFVANGGQFFLTSDTGSIGVTAPGIVIGR